VKATPAGLQASLVALAKRGQAVYDFAHAVYRYRPILSVALSESLLGAEPEEIVSGRKLAAGPIRVVRRESVGDATIFVAEIDGMKCESIIDRDGAIAKAKCGCSYFFKSGLRRGPCRHLFALRSLAIRESATSSTASIASTRSGSSATGFETVSLKWTRDVRERVAAEAERRGATLSEIVAQAWKIGRADLAKKTTAVSMVGEKIDETLSIESALLGEMQREAARLDVSLGAVIESCFEMVEKTMKLTSSVLPRS
jgi:hypothetical protein